MKLFPRATEKEEVAENLQTLQIEASILVSLGPCFMALPALR